MTPQNTTQHHPSPSRILLWVFVCVTVWKVWLGSPEVIPVASAQIPDSGAQRRVLIEEVRKANQLLTQISETLRTGTIKVRIIGPDNTKANSKTGKGR